MGADIGSISYVGLLFNDDTGIYRQVILYEDSDWFRENSSPEANTLKEWLMKVLMESHQKPDPPKFMSDKAAGVMRGEEAFRGVKASSVLRRDL